MSILYPPDPVHRVIVHKLVLEGEWFEYADDEARLRWREVSWTA